MSNRNAFENNSTPIPKEALAGVEDKVFMVLPPLPEGQWYELEHIGDRVVILVEKG